MSAKSAVEYIRVEIITGSHMKHAFIEPTVREEGWRKIHRARRIARRLDIDPRRLPEIR